MKEVLLKADLRTRTQARDQLAEWMAYLFEEQLASRDLALRRARNDPTRHRQILDSGFELLEEVTDPDLRLRPTRPPPSQPKPQPTGGLLGLAAAVLGTWRWFLLVFAALVFLSIAAGVYIGSSYDERYGYLNVVADSDDVAIIIGGKSLGEAPVESIPVIPGRHRITGRLGAQTRTVEVRVKPGESKLVRLEFVGH
jgi:hypothetical protein